MRRLTREEAIALGGSGWWKNMSEEEVFMFQHEQDLLCMPFAEFHRCTEVALGRPVWTHEFADRDGLWNEFQGKTPKKTVSDVFQQLVDMVGANRVIPIVVDNSPPVGEEGK